MLSCFHSSCPSSGQLQNDSLQAACYTCSPTVTWFVWTEGQSHGNSNLADHTQQGKWLAQSIFEANVVCECFLKWTTTRSDAFQFAVQTNTVANYSGCIKDRLWAFSTSNHDRDAGKQSRDWTYLTKGLTNKMQIQIYKYMHCEFLVTRRCEKIKAQASDFRVKMHVRRSSTTLFALTLHICWQKSLWPGAWGQRNSQVSNTVLQFEGWNEKTWQRI